jgi:hypothetical protein
VSRKTLEQQLPKTLIKEMLSKNGFGHIGARFTYDSKIWDNTGARMAQDATITTR